MRDCGAPIIHGHTHSPEQVSFSNEGTIQVHVGVDAWDFTPVEQGVVVQIVKDAGHW
jgi:calcineurin-like phosphoesterase family protein